MFNLDELFFWLECEVMSQRCSRRPFRDDPRSSPPTVGETQGFALVVHSVRLFLRRCPKVQVFELGRMTALQEEGGGVRDIVAGEVIRRLTTKTGPSGEGRHSSFPIRTVNKIRMRVRCTCTSGCDRTGFKGHNHHHLWHQCVWLHIKKSHAVGSGQGGRGATSTSWRVCFVQNPPLVSGRTTPGQSTRLIKEKGGEQGDPLMSFLFSLCRGGCVPQRGLWRILMTSVSRPKPDAVAATVQELWVDARSGDTVSTRCASWLGSGPQSVVAVPCLGSPLPRTGDTVVSLLSPPCNGRPSTTTSKRLLSPATCTFPGPCLAKTCSSRLCPPTSLWTLAAALSRAKPLLPKAPPRTCCAVMAKGSDGRPLPQM